MVGRIRHILMLFVAMCSGYSLGLDRLDSTVLYLEQTLPQPAVLSNVLPPPANSGLKGAEVGIEDSNTTGRFLQHYYDLKTVITAKPLAAVDAAREWVGEGNSLIVANLPSETLLEVANHAAIKGHALVFNIANKDDELRTKRCTPGLLHTIPSRAMLADALAQFLVARRWNQWLLMQGQRPEDQLFALSLRRAGKRFGGKFVAEKTWTFDTDLRRTAQQEMPLFTQVGKYDVTLVADESGDVGEYIPYNTSLPRPVAGTQGLTPVAWHRVVEQWGAVQLQNRFSEHAKRPMNAIDYAAWVAIRAIAEGVTRTGNNNPAALYRYILSDKFRLGAFKGRTLSFRPWNGQLRQPIPLVHPRALVSQSPQEGFLHPRTELDTLGYDEPEVECDFTTSL